MSQEMNSGRERKPKALGGDLVIPIAGSAFTIYYFSSIWDAPWEAQVSALFSGSVLLLLFSAITIVTFFKIFKGAGTLSLRDLWTPRALAPKRLILLALVVLFIVLIPFGGFTLVSFVFLLAALRLLNPKRPMKLTLIIAASFSLLGYLLFIVLFRTPFPDGPFEILMKGVF